MSEPMSKPAVLFVDDETLSRKYFSRFFGKTYEVLTAGDGQEGLECYHANRDRIGIVVTDQMMPEMTGLEFLAQLEAEGSQVVRVLSTAYADSAEVAEASERGLVEFFITKPWDLPELESLLEQAGLRWEGRTSSAA